MEPRQPQTTYDLTANMPWDEFTKAWARYCDESYERIMADFGRGFVANQIAHYGDSFAWSLIDWNRVVAPRLTRLLERVA